MSRIGNQPITIPQGVTIDTTNDLVKIASSGNELSVNVPNGISVNVDDTTLTISRENNAKHIRAAHGLVRAMIDNAIVGVTKGFKKQLEVNGVGFKVAVQGSTLKLALGLSHDVLFDLPQDVKVTAEKNLITIEGSDKQRVGQVAAEIRALKKPEPYKGKGIKYLDEYIVRKAGKTAGSSE